MGKSSPPFPSLSFDGGSNIRREDVAITVLTKTVGEIVGVFDMELSFF